jgi:hypothetical protein
MPKGSLRRGRAGDVIYRFYALPTQPRPHETFWASFARVFRNFTNYRARILFHCGKLNLAMV